jgi:hypothetical protein
MHYELNKEIKGSPAFGSQVLPESPSSLQALPVCESGLAMTYQTEPLSH